MNELTEIQCKILLLVREHPNGMVRAQLVLDLDVPRTTIYDNLHKLEKMGLVERFRVMLNEGRSHPFTAWKEVREP